MVSRKALWLLAALVLMLVLLSGCRPKPLTKVSVALDWYPWSNHTGLFLAQENGYYKDEGLDVNIYVPANPEDVLKLVGAGKDNFGISYHTDVLQARSEGLPVKSIAALVQHPLNSVMTLKESNIVRPKQLEGKKVGYPGIPSNEAYLTSMMQADGSSINKIELVNVGFNLVEALIGKKVDAIIGAYWVHESILAEQQGYPVNIMKVEEWGVPDFYELLLVSSDDMIKKNPDIVKRFMRATVKGYKDAMSDHKKALDVLIKANPETDRKLEEKGIELLSPLWSDNIPTFGWQTAERWRSYAEWMKQNGFVKKDLNTDDAFTSEFVPSQ
ncbi:MAG: ABC transporter substrate-binding protein [Chloroflexi bacterium]|nr:ABC transporter substrate-binding protein [Chloroflexota bacterium]